MNVSVYQWLRISGWIAVCCIGIVGISIGWMIYRWPQLAADGPESATVDTPPALSWSDASTIPPNQWEVMRHSDAAPTPSAGPLAQRFRLAGTFFAYPGDQADPLSDARRAIIDDLRQNRQRLVREGEDMEGVEVVQIYRDRIILREGADEENLWLSFSDAAVEHAAADTPDGPDIAQPGVPLRFEDMPSLEESAFGRRIDEDRWILQRDALLRYADELQDDPERLTKLFLAMPPVYDDEDEISGFQLDMLGEDALYEAAGFQDGDIVRLVNSMPMTSPHRAQYFIREFMSGRINAFVFEIERDGEELKLIHLIR